MKIKRPLVLLLGGLLLAGLGLGCSGDKDKGINKNSDRPRASSPEKK